MTAPIVDSDSTRTTPVPRPAGRRCPNYVHDRAIIDHRDVQRQFVDRNFRIVAFSHVGRISWPKGIPRRSPCFERALAWPLSAVMLSRLVFILMLALGVAFEPSPTPELNPTPQPTLEPTTGPIRIVFGLTTISVVVVIAAAIARCVEVNCVRRRASRLLLAADPEVGKHQVTSLNYACSSRTEPLCSLGSDVVAWDDVSLTPHQ